MGRVVGLPENQCFKREVPPEAPVYVWSPPEKQHWNSAWWEDEMLRLSCLRRVSSTDGRHDILDTLPETVSSGRVDSACIEQMGLLVKGE